MPDSPSFDLVISAVDGGYTARVQSAFGVGELPPQAFALPLDLTTLPRQDDVEEWVKQVRIVRRSIEIPELQQARALGTALFEGLFRDELLACFRESRIALPRDAVLLLRLRLPPALAALPWELLHDPRDDQFLALAPDIVLVRYPELPEPVAPLAIDGPLQVVIVAASPADCPPLDVERELRRITGALKTPVESGRLALEIIRGPDTLAQLQTRLRRPAHVVHIMCHGTLDEQHGEGVLVFEDMESTMELVNAELLRMLIQRQRGQTRLVVLNACLGALPAGGSPFSSVGAALIRGGVPAVLAMQFSIPDEVAVDLARVFYGELAAGTPVDLAVNETRMQLYARNPYRLDWVIPVLFLRAADGALFDVATPEIIRADDAPGRPDPEATSMPTVRLSPAPLAEPDRRRGPRGWLWLMPVVALLALLVLLRGLLPAWSRGSAAATTTAPQLTAAPAAANAASGTSPAGASPTAEAGGGALPAPSFATAAPTARPLAGLNVSNTPGRSDGAEVGVDATGTLHVAWLDNTPRQGKGETILHRQMGPDGAWSNVQDWSPGAEYLGQIYWVRNGAGKLCMINAGVAGMYHRCSANGAWTALEEPERLGTVNAFSPALDPDGHIQRIAGLNEIKIGDAKLDDGLADVGWPALAIDTAGGYHAAWWRGGNPYSIEYRYSPDGGKTWQPARRLSAPDARFAERPALAADGAGGVHLAWEESGKVLYRRWTRDGGWSAPVELARGAGAGPPFLATDSRNLAHVVWQRDFDVRYTQQAPDGSWSAPRLIAVVKDQIGAGARLAVDGRGVRHFVWEGAGNDGARDIFYAALPPDAR